MNSEFDKFYFALVSTINFSQVELDDSIIDSLVEGKESAYELVNEIHDVYGGWVSENDRSSADEGKGKGKKGKGKKGAASPRGSKGGSGEAGPRGGDLRDAQARE